MIDKAVQAVPIMIDQIIEAGESEICATYHNTGTRCSSTFYFFGL